MDRCEVDKIEGGMRSDDKFMGRLQLDGGPEIGDSERDGFAIIHITWVSHQTHPRVRLVLEAIAISICFLHFGRRHWICFRLPSTAFFFFCYVPPRFI